MTRLSYRDGGNVDTNISLIIHVATKQARLAPILFYSIDRKQFLTPIFRFFRKSYLRIMMQAAYFVGNITPWSSKSVNGA